MIMKLVLSLAVICLSACVHPGRHAVDSDPSLLPERALVFVYRNRAPALTPLPLTVKEDETVIGTLENGSYFYYYATPGRHYYSVILPNPESGHSDWGAFAEVAAGKRHFLQVVPELKQGHLAVHVYAMFETQAAPVVRSLRNSTRTH